MTENEREDLKLFCRLAEAVCAKGGNLRLVNGYVEFDFNRGVRPAHWRSVRQCLRGGQHHESIFQLCQWEGLVEVGWQWLGEMDGMSNEEMEIRLCAMGF